MPNREQALAFAHENRDRFLEDLKALCTIPSISTSPEYKAEVRRAAEWVAAHMRKIGLENVEVTETPGHPVVYGEWLHAGADAPTVLVYGHYDVQPADPLDLWETPAFEPTVRGEKLYARGATDMKGQVMASLHAAEAMLRSGGAPVNLKFFIEGEEESGSINLAAYIRENKEKLACSVALNPDTGMVAPDLPTITYALRGLVYFELKVFGPKGDLHSGVFGGVVHNPGQVMAELIAGMHDADGRVTLPGFYDRVIDLDEAERAELARLPIDETFYLQQSGAPALWEGEKGYTAVERAGARPTLEVNGLYSGFIGEGAKTVLPSYALAKISCRLVPDQDPEEVAEQMRAYLKAHAPETVTWELTVFPGPARASLSRIDSPGVQALAKAQETVWGKRPIFKREGGSVPVVGDIQNILGVDVVNTGFALPGDNMHAPNESLHLPTWYKGIDALTHFFFNL
ncbi:MAG: dipeptidase [Anaerolineae bacterium]|nr:MAG: dipeptidase [Anaerolineae bacterium]